MKKHAHFYRLLFILVFLLVWEAFVFLNILNPLLLPAPSRIFLSLIELITNGQLPGDILISLQRVAIGFSISLLTAIPLGLLMGMNKKINYIIEPVVNFIKPIPPIAWIPVAIIWFGIGNKLTYFITAIASFFPVFINTLVGVENVPKEHINAAKCFGASKRMLLTDIIIPAALPYIFSGIRIGLGFAWMSIVAAEMITSISGLGYLIIINQQMLRLDRVFVGMIIIGFVGLLLDNALVLLKKAIIRW